MSDNLFGWELTFKSVESSLANNKTDVVIVFIHFVLLKNKFKCVGIGDDKTLSETDKASQSELLPDGWNQMDGDYKLRYVCNDKLYIFMAKLMDDDLLIGNFLSVDGLKLSNVTLDINETVTVEGRTAANAIKKSSEVYDKIQKDLIEPVFSGTQVSTQTQTEKKTVPPIDPLRDERLPSRNPIMPDYDRQFPDVGRGDLDPFGRGGGMLFDPRGLGPRNPGSFPGPLNPRIPFGARFDPYGPPRPDRFEPNPDHFRPPGYDDMFM
uniref:Proteasome inhibitor PI31 subunit n=1 Tax=Culicoides sonorensis TaxID=179676 RepID=A0A336K604_CULSO